MKPLIKAIILSMIFGSLLGCFSVSDAQNRGSQEDLQIITGVRIDAASGSPGALHASIDGVEKEIANGAVAAWVISDGKQIVFSGQDGAGGYENEGQSLRIYDMGTGSRRKVLSEYFVIDDVTEVRTGAGQTALVVEMRDGGLGASHIAIVDPTRGEVFSKSRAKLLKYDTDVLVLGYYREEDWERMARGDEISPYETERYNLDSLLQRPVIINIGRTP